MEANKTAHSIRDAKCGVEWTGVRTHGFIRSGTNESDRT